MKGKDKIGFKGKLHLRHFDAEGNLLHEFTKDNLIVNSGLAYFAGRNASDAVPAINHMAIGDSAVDPNILDTTLGNELGRVSTANSNMSTEVMDDTAVFTSVFGAGVGVGAITEAGLFNSNSNGLMVSRLIFPVINKGENDSISATWSIQSK